MNNAINLIATILLFAVGTYFFVEAMSSAFWGFGEWVEVATSLACFIGFGILILKTINSYNLTIYKSITGE